MVEYRSVIKSFIRSNTVARLARGLLWTVLGAVLSRGLLLIASIYVTRALGKEGYGEYLKPP